MRKALRGGLALALVPAAIALAAPGAAQEGQEAQVAQDAQVDQETPEAQAEHEAQVAEAGHPGDSLRVYLLTVGRGELVWEKFGHNAIRIVDERAGSDVAWNWGIFDFTQESFWPRLVSGDMLYSMGAFRTERTLHQYDVADRPVWQQELALTADQKLRLQRAIHEHWRPENRDYLYDYYRDNCSTRVRDMLDAALDGAIRRTLAGDTMTTTYRWHTRRLLADAPTAYAGIQLVLGTRADEPITRWDEGFLPMRLQRYLRDVTVEGPDGARRPLVREEVQLVRAERPPAPAGVPNRLGWAAMIGVVLAGVLLVLGRRAGRGSAPARVGFAAVATLWSVAAGVAGALILGAWLFTRHHFWGANENLLQTSPLLLGVAALVLPLLWRDRPGPGAVALAAVVAGLSLLGFAVQPLPGLDQVNGEIIALALPANVALAVALARLAPRETPEPRTKPADAAVRATPRAA